MAKERGRPEVKILSGKHEAKIASTKQTKGGEFIWSQDRCTGCIRCVRQCPVDAITVDRGKEIAKKVRLSPCSQACPAGIDVPRYLRFIAEGKFSESTAVIRERIPFPLVCGYICTHPCEAKCQRGQIDESILIRVLKRVAAERDTGEWKKNVKEAPPTGKMVAVIGSGPAGLTAAYYLRQKGHTVTVFEAAPKAGGLLRYGIPEYRLPKKMLDNDIGYIEQMGVEIKTNNPVKSLADILAEGYNAVFLGIGASSSLKLGIPDEDSEGVIPALDLLGKVNSGEEVTLGKRVTVIGGGSVAIDAARTSIRLGAEEVHLVCLETRDMEHRDKMLAQEQEIYEAEEEGLIIHPCLGPKEIIVKAGRVAGLVTVNCCAVSDEAGHFAPQFTEEPSPAIETDSIIVAIGQTVDKSAPADELVHTEKGTIKVDPVTLQTSLAGVFAGGDAVSGPDTVIGAIAVGRLSASSIDKYLGGDGNIEEILASPVEKEVVIPLREPKGGLPPEVPKRILRRLGDGTYVDKELGLKEKDAIKEARRCLKCDIGYPVDEFEVDTMTCTYCGRCVETCYWDAILAGVGYEKAAKERQEELEETAIKYRLQDRVLTILVVSVAIIILGIVAVKLLAS